jgi:hypothetical protein
MDALARQFCQLCRSELCVADAVRTHLIADHKRSAMEADELVARFDTDKSIPRADSEPHMYCAADEPAGDGRSSAGTSAAQAAVVN